MRPFSFRTGPSGASRILKWIGIVVLALIALLLLAGAVLAAVGGNWLRGPVERAALENTGRVLKIGGDIDIGFGWPPRLRVRTSDVSFANAEWGKRPQMLTVGEADVELSLLRLLIGRVVVAGARVRNADVSLEKDAQGRKNWDLPGEPGKTQIRRIELADSRIAYDDPSRAPVTAAVASARVSHKGETWRAEEFSARIGQSEVSGNVRVDTSDERLAIAGELAFGTLALADLGMVLGKDEKRERILPDKPIDTAAWRDADIDLRLSAAKIVGAGKVPIERLAARVHLRDAMLTLEPVELGIAGGKVTGTAQFDGRGKDIRAKAAIKANKVAPDRLLPDVDTSRVDVGRIDGAIDLAGSGRSVAEIVGSANGSAAALIDGGHASRLLLEAIGLHLPRLAALAAGGDRLVPIRCGALDFRIEKGIMHAQTALLDTTVTTVRGSGTIDLRNETLDLTLTERPKETSLLSLKSPIHVRGPFSDPDIDVEAGGIAARGLGAAALAAANPLLALLPLIEAGPGADSNCGRLLTQSEAAEDAKKTPPKRTRGK